MEHLINYTRQDFFNASVQNVEAFQGRHVFIVNYFVQKFVWYCLKSTKQLVDDLLLDCKGFHHFFYIFLLIHWKLWHYLVFIDRLPYNLLNTFLCVLLRLPWSDICMQKYQNKKLCKSRSKYRFTQSFKGAFCFILLSIGKFAKICFKNASCGSALMNWL